MVSFDQYQRYRTIGNMIREIQKEYSLGEDLKILEVGANAQRNLEKFVSASICYTDIEMQEGFEDCDDFFIADATDLAGIEDGQYDVVVASDVFEHIPPQLRENFIAETARVAKYASILCFPFAADHVSDAERRLNQYYKSIWGEDYIWLQEHIANGLPELDRVQDMLRRNHLGGVSCKHGDTYVWEMMFKAHFYAASVEELMEYRQGIDEMYNRMLYPCDVTDFSYRIFYMIFHEQEKEDFYAGVMSRLFCRDRQKWEEGVRRLEGLCRDLYHIEDARERNLRRSEEGEISPAFVYFDMGEGFSESCFEELSRVSLEGENVYEIDLTGRPGVKAVRFDPVDGMACELSDLSVEGDGGRELSFIDNAVERGGYLCYTTRDPQIIISPLEGVERIRIRFHIAVAGNERESAMLWARRAALADMEEENAGLEEKNAGLEEVKKLREQELVQARILLENAEQRYQAIVHSRYWRLTAPLRSCTDALKKIRFIRALGHKILAVKRKGFPGAETPAGPGGGIPQESRYRGAGDYALEPVEEKILFSILVPLYNTHPQHLRELIESVQAQTYAKWELILGDASDSGRQPLEEICKEYQESDGRIVYLPIENNGGISANTNRCARAAKGEYLVLCDHDDVLHRQALQMNALMIRETRADVLYSDEDHLDAAGHHIAPLYKPDWSPDLLRSQMYTCHLFVFRRELFEEAGGLRPEYDGSQDYDLMLRFSERTQNIIHIPAILYSWRESETSTAANPKSKPYAHTAGKNALDAHLKRQFGENAAAEETDHLFVYRAKFSLGERQPLISIIIPMKDQRRLSDRCVRSILEKSAYENYEILLLNNRSEKKETYQWFERITQESSRVRVVHADFAFNWSRLNNFGMRHAKGDVYIFLNNDMEVISPGWMEDLAANALRKDIGVVGAMLLYEDGTIQHDGIVVGMGGWADHLYKRMRPAHCGTPFISPMPSRNVMAVTGACMAVSREVVDAIGEFDESFIICGSDVEICIRAYEAGWNNLLRTDVLLYHLESKSRDSYIPDADFTNSYRAYTMCREFGDPYYNLNLSRDSVIPKEGGEKVDWMKIKEHLKTNRYTKQWYKRVKEALLPPPGSNPDIAEIQGIVPREIALPAAARRINIIVPSVDVKHVFGGIATALSFYEMLTERTGVLRRIIVTDAEVCEDTMVSLPHYRVVSSDQQDAEDYQIVPFADRSAATLPVAENDIFLATGWWTAYNVMDVLRWQEKTYGKRHPLLYFIQDYEPGFYPWSSRYLLAESTYRSDVPVFAIVNSRQLYDFLEEGGYEFEQSYYFEPVLNAGLKKFLREDQAQRQRKNQILVYGRPSVDRNAFELIVEALRRWSVMECAKDWEVLSAGEAFGDIPLGGGKTLVSIGKVSLEEYAKIMLETKVGISLMVSPHPSYPPLEMSTFGIHVITNRYDNKDLSGFNENITSLASCSAEAIAQKLAELCESGAENRLAVDTGYVRGELQWSDIIDDIAGKLWA